MFAGKEDSGGTLDERDYAILKLEDEELAFGAIYALLIFEFYDFSAIPEEDEFLEDGSSAELEELEPIEGLEELNWLERIDELEGMDELDEINSLGIGIPFLSLF